jgi:tetratricopeptide (TPR) repeat protein
MKARIPVCVGVGLAAVVILCGCSTPPAQHDRAGDLPKTQMESNAHLSASTFVAHGYLLEQQGKYEQAAGQYREALSLTPGLIAARNRLGVVLNRLGQHAEASRQFRTALETAPRLAYLHNNLGFSLYLEGRFTEAEPELARALELQPDFRRAHMNHGLTLARLTRWDDALHAFQNAVPEADAHYNMALLQSEMRYYAEAAHSLEQALQANPDFAVARELLRDVSRRAAAEELAREAAAEAHAVKPPETTTVGDETPMVEPLPPSAAELGVATEFENVQPMSTVPDNRPPANTEAAPNNAPPRPEQTPPANPPSGPTNRNGSNNPPPPAQPSPTTAPAAEPSPVERDARAAIARELIRRALERWGKQMPKE